MSFLPFQPVRWFITYPNATQANLGVFPLLPGQSLKTSKSLIQKTSIATSASGRERRVSFWTAPRWLFKVKYEALRNYPPYNELFTLYSFYRQQAGMLSDFYFYDAFDNQVVNQSLGIGNGSTSTFQLIRWLNGNPNAVEPIYAVTARPTIYFNNVAISPSLFYVGSYGSINFNSPPAAGVVITWSGFFYFLCRFDSDQIDTVQDFYNVFSCGELAWRSVKPDRS